MKLGIDSFAAVPYDTAVTSTPQDRAQALEYLLDRIVAMEEAGLDTFGLGEHHRKEYLDASPLTILAAAAARTSKIRLLSAVTVLSAADPVRVYQQLATLDLLSKGRAGLVAGRGSFSEAFPLFGLNFQDYDALYEEKLELLLALRDNETLTWEGRFRSALTHQAVYPRPYQSPIPIYVGVGGTPQSVVRAGKLGLPLMLAIIGGETHRFRPLVDLYKETGLKHGFNEDQLTVSVHSLGYVAPHGDQARDEFFPGYAKTFSRIGQERGWGGGVTRAQFDAVTHDRGALIVGDPQEVADKISRHSEALGGIEEMRLHMNVADLSQEQYLQSIHLLGKEVRPLLDQ